MRRLIVVLALCAMSVGCKEEGATPAVPEGAIAGAGMMHKGVGPECPETWHIGTPDGKMYWPVENANYQVEGMNVQFVVREKHGAMSICQAGTMVDVLAIRPVESAQ